MFRGLSFYINLLFLYSIYIAIFSNHLQDTDKEQY